MKTDYPDEKKSKIPGSEKKTAVFLMNPTGITGLEQNILETQRKKALMIWIP